MESKLIRKAQLKIAGIMGDGTKTAELWETFENKSDAVGLDKKTDSPGYEVRFYYICDGKQKCDCFVGLAVADKNDANDFELLTLPAYEYAMFDVIVANGYDSENANMNKWLDEHKEVYNQAEIDGKRFVVECYNERFKEGIVEIWIPLARV